MPSHIIAVFVSNLIVFTCLLLWSALCMYNFWEFKWLNELKWSCKQDIFLSLSHCVFSAFILSLGEETARHSCDFLLDPSMFVHSALSTIPLSIIRGRSSLFQTSSMTIWSLPRFHLHWKRDTCLIYSFFFSLSLRWRAHSWRAVVFAHTHRHRPFLPPSLSRIRFLHCRAFCSNDRARERMQCVPTSKQCWLKKKETE